MTAEIDLQMKAARNHLKLSLDTKPQSFQAAYRFCQEYTMTSVERLYQVYSCTQSLLKQNVAGDIVECGVWRGGSLMMAALAARDFGDTSRRIFACDTFEGHPRPDPVLDKDVWGQDMAAIYDQKSAAHEKWNKASIEDVSENLASTGYPGDKLIYLKGRVEDTLPCSRINRICLLRLDTDWYESTAHIFKTLYPKLSYGGVFVVDDYGHMEGARRATDEFISGCADTIHLINVDYSCVVGVKCGR